MTPPQLGPKPQPPLPPILRDLFPKTSATMRKLSPSQAIAFVELLMKQLSKDPRLPLRVTTTKHSPFKLTIDIDVLASAFDTTAKED